MKSAEEIADEAYQVIVILSRVANIDVANRDVIRALDYFSGIASGDEVGDILPWGLHLDK